MTKYLVTNTANNFSSLQLEWASRNNCRQRQGRAGRVMDGRVYRMIPKKFFSVRKLLPKAKKLLKHFY